MPRRRAAECLSLRQIGVCTTLTEGSTGALILVTKPATPRFEWLADTIQRVWTTRQAPAFFDRDDLLRREEPVGGDAAYRGRTDDWNDLVAVPAGDEVGDGHLQRAHLHVGIARSRTNSKRSAIPRMQLSNGGSVPDPRY